MGLRRASFEPHFSEFMRTIKVYFTKSCLRLTRLTDWTMMLVQKMWSFTSSKNAALPQRSVRFNHPNTTNAPSSPATPVWHLYIIDTYNREHQPNTHTMNYQTIRPEQWWDSRKQHQSCTVADVCVWSTNNRPTMRREFTFCIVLYADYYIQVAADRWFHVSSNT